ncbi:uncharacterized membrane protein (DUF485 family) [Agromyces flavus]|uniref:Uncharacterized membrane protein (DUF485 family) n=1 Tax=Agromyces flavus TaxID=589382 RepID=A0A1H1ZK86_9MICO|nr:hypothetical protein [Agromyces flavus]MCP2367134.1 uncharacterized membrane protein (DUF485 family) [Agromyces flavus]GGI46330.1 hypothetical protein GCM10010932_14080 [Agromyces flavus]SDT34138.1 hypothetical protein SAMN04489721_3213 [Agromyces flavus]
MSEPERRPEPAAGPPQRVRVTAPRTGAVAASARRSTARRRTAVGPGPSSDVQAVYVRSLIRSQLRLALVCAAAFVVATAAFAVGVALLPGLGEVALLGVPVSWLLLGVGVYPLAITVAALYVRAATRNEARYRSLAEDA